MLATDFEGIIDKFDSFTQKPVKFLTVQDNVKEDIKHLVKSIYDYTKSQENDVKKEKKTALSKLIVKDFDEEQIWQELELQNNECWDELVWEVANCMSSKDALLFPVKTKDEHISMENEAMSEDSDGIQQKTSKKSSKKKAESTEFDNEDDIEDENQPVDNPTFKDSNKKVRPSVVDDKFFKLQEMEQFLLKEEKKEGKDRKKAESDSEDDSIDMFEEEEDDEEQDDKNTMYNDFFAGDNDQQNYMHNEGDVIDDNDDVSEENITEEVKSKSEKKKVKFAIASSDDETDSDDNAKAPKQLINGKPARVQKTSEFEQRQERLQQTICRLEEKTLKDAPWQLKGEVDASKRPQNSLLQEVVDFDLTSRPAPIITEETTLTLEDIIRRRIKDKAWDDVVKKEKPVDDQLNFRKPEIIDQSKSKLSLAQVYEAEYLKQKKAASGDVEEEKEPEAHTEIRDAMSKLFSKLDALCHYHYTPRAPQAEVKIVTNTPAINMEEVAPVATSDATLLAPEEVKRKRKGDLMSKEERSQTDKKRERRKKKNLQRKKGKVEKVTEHRNTKKAVEANDKSLKTSKAFFQQLNDDATSIIKNKNKRNIKTKG